VAQQPQPTPSGGHSKSGSISDQFVDLVDLIKKYALQETVDPLRGAARFLGYGLLGGVFIATGCGLLLLSLLRFLQSRDVAAFHDNWSFVPYLIVLVPCLVLIAIAVSRIEKTGLDRPKDQR